MAELYDRGTDSGSLPYNSAMNLRDFLARHPVFRLKEFMSVFPELSTEAAKKQLLRAVARGEIKSVGRALYAVVPGGQKASQYLTDPYLLMQSRDPDAVFCGHSALELNGLAYSVWNEVTAYTSGNRQSFKREGTKFRLLTTPIRMAKKGCDFALRTVDRQGTSLRVLGPERTLVEGFRSPKDFGGLAEFLASIAHLQRIDQFLLLDVLEAFNERKLYACVGWALENRRSELMISEEIIRFLMIRQPEEPAYLTRSMGPVRRAKGWKLLIPEQLYRMEDTDAPEF